MGTAADTGTMTIIYGDSVPQGFTVARAEFQAVKDMLAGDAKLVVFTDIYGKETVHRAEMVRGVSFMPVTA